MKNRKTLLLSALTAIAIFSLSAWISPPEGGEINIGDGVPMMSQKMMDVQSGNEVNLRESHQKQGLLVIFSCNTCPFVIQWEDRYNELYDLCKKNDIGMVLVNSNEAKRNGDDSKEEMIAKAKKEGYKMPYLIDANHQVADAFGARTTPHVFLFDKDAKLSYRGLIDDNGEDKSKVENHYLMDAINNMVAGEKIDPVVTKSIGCSIKRVKK